MHMHRGFLIPVLGERYDLFESHPAWVRGLKLLCPGARRRVRAWIEMRYPSDMHHCPLLEKEIFWGGEGGCYEIQEVRDDNMDAEFLPFELDMERANDICEKCRWCYVNESE